MQRSSHNMLVLGLIALLLSACASVTPQFPVDASFWQERQARVGVVLAEHGEPAAHMEGAQGLLDIAINQGNASELTAHLKTLELKQADEMVDRLVNGLRGRNMQATKLNGKLDVAALSEFEAPAADGSVHYAARDYRALAGQHQVDRLVVLSITRVGTTRSYYGFIPLGPPQGLGHVSGQLIDLKTNRLLWNTASTRTVPSAGEWDEPPSYPGLTQAMYQAFDEANKDVVAHFFNPTGVASK